jgi:hypothetical protein
MVKRNVRFFSTGLFITHLWYAFDLSQYRKATPNQRYPRHLVQLEMHAPNQTKPNPN